MPRKYDLEFKLEAVRLGSEPGVTNRDVERRLGIGQGVLSRWKKELKRDGQQAFPGKGHLKPDRFQSTEQIHWRKGQKPPPQRSVKRPFPCHYKVHTKNNEFAVAISCQFGVSSSIASLFLVKNYGLALVILTTGRLFIR